MNFQANKLLQTIIKKVPESEGERESITIYTNTHREESREREKWYRRGRRHSSQWKIWDIEYRRGICNRVKQICQIMFFEW